MEIFGDTDLSARDVERKLLYIPAFAKSGKVGFLVKNRFGIYFGCKFNKA